MNDREKYVEWFDLMLRFHNATQQFWCGPSSEVSGFPFPVVAAISTKRAVPGRRAAAWMFVSTSNYLHMKKIMENFACLTNAGASQLMIFL